MTSASEQASVSPTGVLNVDVAVRVATQRIRAGDFATAETVLTPVVEANPAHRTARYLLGMARFRAGDFAGAEQTYRALVGRMPEDAEGQYGLGVSLARLGRRDEAVDALRAALVARPDFTEAQTKLDELGAGANPSTRSDGWRSLAELLDSRAGPPLDDGMLAGEPRWAGRPFPLALIPAAVGAGAALVAPLVLRNITEALPSGSLRDLMAQVWRLAAAASIPLAILIGLVGLVAWLSTRYTVRERRLEVVKGVVKRRHIVLWFHDIERQVVVEQSLLDQVLGLASVVLTTDALLLSRASRRSRLGRLALRGLAAGRAYELAAVIREATLRERRRMVQNFISTR